MDNQFPENTNDDNGPSKGDDLIRHLHILDALAYDSLNAQLNFIGTAVRNDNDDVKPKEIIGLKWLASKKYNLFGEVKKSFLKSTEFIDINVHELPEDETIHNIVRRCNMTLFFSLLFANFDSSVPNFKNVNDDMFFDYVVPSTLRSEEIWDLDLNLRVQIYISKLYKNLPVSSFGLRVKGPPMYMETRTKVLNIISHSEDIDKLMKEFKWIKFVEEMYKTLSNIANELDEPILHKYTSLSVSTSAVVECTSRTEVDSSTKKDQDSSSKREETEPMVSHDIDNQAETDSRFNSSDESCNSDLGRRTTRREHDNYTNTDNQPMVVNLAEERSSSSPTLEQQVDDRQTNSDESSSPIERTPSFEQEDNSRKRGEKRVIDHSNADQRMIKRIRIMWSEQELRALEDAMRKHGKSWTVIKKNYGSEGQVLEHRTAAQIKDKARSELTRRQREECEVGVFGIMDVQ